MLSGAKPLEYWNLEFQDLGFVFNWELFPAIRCNLFVAPEASGLPQKGFPSDASGLSGLGKLFSEEIH